jgi:hypothetical protein
MRPITVAGPQLLAAAVLARSDGQRIVAWAEWPIAVAWSNTIGTTGAFAVWSKLLAAALARPRTGLQLLPASALARLCAWA